MAKLLDGKALARETRARLADAVARRARDGLRPPGLATILVGEDPASKVYVGRKQRESREVGMLSRSLELAADVGEAELLEVVTACNRDEQIDGVLVQMPLPDHIDEERVIRAIDPAKDVDGLHPLNQGALLGGEPGVVPCTPAGCMRLLASTARPLSGLEAVVVGRSRLVGKPLALLLLAEHATVTLCHSRTRDLATQVGRADILVAALGVPRAIRGEWIKPGALVIDVGINRVEEGLVGDVDFETAEPRASHITPVPGGVGPMTVAMLLENTLRACEKRDSGRS